MHILKEGLGAAYIRGMEHALGDLGADAVFEMDADFSHKPEDVLDLQKLPGAGTIGAIGCPCAIVKKNFTL